MSLVLLILLLVLVFGGLPQLGLHQYGYGPSGFAAVIVVILLILLLSGQRNPGP